MEGEYSKLEIFCDAADGDSPVGAASLRAAALAATQRASDVAGRARRRGTSFLARLRADDEGVPPGGPVAPSPSVPMGVVMGLTMGGSLAGVVAGRPRGAARKLRRRRRDHVAVGIGVVL